MLYEPEEVSELHLQERIRLRLEVIDLIEKRQKVNAIKHTRAETGCSLKRAKEYVDSLERDIKFFGGDI